MLKISALKSSPDTLKTPAGRPEKRHFRRTRLRGGRVHRGAQHSVGGTCRREESQMLKISALKSSPDTLKTPAERPGKRHFRRTMHRGGRAHRGAQYSVGGYTYASILPAVASARRSNGSRSRRRAARDFLRNRELKIIRISQHRKSTNNCLCFFYLPGRIF